MSANTQPISVHQRSYQTEAFDDGDGTMRVWGRLIDTKPSGLGLGDGKPIVIHDMEITLRVDPNTFVINAVDSTMHVHPYGDCPSILTSYQQLIGNSITRGYSRLVKELFGGPNGCSHLGALLIALGPVAIQASWGFDQNHQQVNDRLEGKFGADDAERQLKMNTNTCHHWSEGGAPIALLRKGERPARPTWETDRLKELAERQANQ